MFLSQKGWVETLLSRNELWSERIIFKGIETNPLC